MLKSLRAASARIAALALPALLWAIPQPGQAQAVAFGGMVPGIGVVNLKVTSLQGERFAGLVRQHTDFSCGAASVATILRYAYGRDVSEQSVVDGMLQVVTDPALVRARGFSLLDIKHYVGSLGLQSAGYRVAEPELERLKVPGIVLLDLQGYEHFVVVKRATPGWVYVADPALGNRRLSAQQFQSEWNGIVFVIVGQGYRRENPLMNVQTPPTLELLARGLFPAAPPLGDQVLLSVDIPPANRL